MAAVKQPKQLTSDAIQSANVVDDVSQTRALSKLLTSRSSIATSSSTTIPYLPECIVTPIKSSGPFKPVVTKPTPVTSTANIQKRHSVAWLADVMISESSDTAHAANQKTMSMASSSVMPSGSKRHIATTKAAAAPDKDIQTSTTKRSSMLKPWKIVTSSLDTILSKNSSSIIKRTICISDSEDESPSQHTINNTTPVTPPTSSANVQNSTTATTSPDPRTPSSKSCTRVTTNFDEADQTTLPTTSSAGLNVSSLNPLNFFKSNMLMLVLQIYDKFITFDCTLEADQKLDISSWPTILYITLKTRTFLDRITQNTLFHKAVPVRIKVKPYYTLYKYMKSSSSASTLCFFATADTCDHIIISRYYDKERKVCNGFILHKTTYEEISKMYNIFYNEHE